MKQTKGIFKSFVLKISLTLVLCSLGGGGGHEGQGNNQDQAGPHGEEELGVLFQSTELNLASGGDGLDFYTCWGHYVSRTSPVELLVVQKKI